MRIDERLTCLTLLVLLLAIFHLGWTFIIFSLHFLQVSLKIKVCVTYRMCVIDCLKI